MLWWKAVDVKVATFGRPPVLGSFIFPGYSGTPAKLFLIVHPETISSVVDAWPGSTIEEV